MRGINNLEPYGFTPGRRRSYLRVRTKAGPTKKTASTPSTEHVPQAGSSVFLPVTLKKPCWLLAGRLGGRGTPRGPEACGPTDASSSSARGHFSGVLTNHADGRANSPRKQITVVYFPRINIQKLKKNAAQQCECTNAKQLCAYK